MASHDPTRGLRRATGTVCSRRKLLRALPKLGALTLVAPALAALPASAFAASGFSGVSFDMASDGHGGFHHFVWVHAPVCARGWRVEGPAACWLWPSDKPMCGVYAGPDQNGWAKIGFRWPDWTSDWADPYGWMNPSWFHLYPVS